MGIFSQKKLTEWWGHPPLPRGLTERGCRLNRWAEFVAWPRGLGGTRGHTTFLGDRTDPGARIDSDACYRRIAFSANIINNIKTLIFMFVVSFMKFM